MLPIKKMAEFQPVLAGWGCFICLTAGAHDET